MYLKPNICYQLNKKMSKHADRCWHETVAGYVLKSRRPGDDFEDDEIPTFGIDHPDMEYYEQHEFTSFIFVPYEKPKK